jgi:hypothetical protein
MQRVIKMNRSFQGLKLQLYLLFWNFFMYIVHKVMHKNSTVIIIVKNKTKL